MKRFINRLFHWELWHFNIIYAPLGFVWLCYVVRARAFWFFSNVNPTLTFSGFEGERKKEMYEQLPKHLYPSTIYVWAKEELIYISAHLKEAGIRFPLIAKPDIGTQGLMFRKLNTVNDLIEYHTIINADYVIQAYVDLPEEYSVFYIRYPDKKKGRITGLIRKDYLSVTGNGVSTLIELIQQDDRAKYRWKELSVRHEKNLKTIVPPGEVFYLSIAGNHNRGAKFINLHNEIDEQLCATFDAISDAVPHFFYGRYDLKCSSLAHLKEGKNIQILEFNGTGAEPNHIYDCNMSYFQALKVIAQHWRDLYRISRINYKNGIRYWSFWKGRKHMKQTSRWYKKLRLLDLSFHL